MAGGFADRGEGDDLIRGVLYSRERLSLQLALGSFDRFGSSLNLFVFLGRVGLYPFGGASGAVPNADGCGCMPDCFTQLCRFRYRWRNRLVAASLVTAGPTLTLSRLLGIERLELDRNACQL